MAEQHDTIRYPNGTDGKHGKILHDKIFTLLDKGFSSLINVFLYHFFDIWTLSFI